MISSPFIRYHLFGLRTSHAVAYLRASWRTAKAVFLLLLDTARRLRADVPKVYRAKLQDADDEHWVAREMYVGVLPEALARRACLESNGQTYAHFVGVAHGVGRKYGLL